MKVEREFVGYLWPNYMDLGGTLVGDESPKCFDDAPAQFVENEVESLLRYRGDGEDVFNEHMVTMGDDEYKSRTRTRKRYRVKVTVEIEEADNTDHP